MPDPVLLLDVMGTLVEDPFHDALPRFFGLTLPELLAQKHPTAWVEFECGRLTAPEYYARMFADARAVDGNGLERALWHAYRYLPGIDALLSDLHGRRIEMHALSNYPVWYRLVEDRLGLSRRVPWTFVSCETGVRKPSPAAYESAARTLGVAPSRCLFVDDRPENCAAARAVGMGAIRYESAGDLRARLAAAGLCGH